jgi:hypothetical protein
VGIFKKSEAEKVAEAKIRTSPHRDDPDYVIRQQVAASKARNKKK